MVGRMTTETQEEVEQMFELQGLDPYQAYQKLKKIVLEGVSFEENDKALEIEHRYEVAEDWIGTYAAKANIPWEEVEKVIYG